MGYFSMHNHTEYSNIRLLDATNRVETLFERAIEIGLSGFAITDHEVLSASVELIQTYKDLLKQGKIDEDFTIAYGNEIYLIEDLEDYKENYTRQTHQYYHFLLLSKNERGWEALKELSSTAWANSYMQRGMYRTPLTKTQLRKTMCRYKGDIIASTACLGGELPQLIMEFQRTKTEDEQERLKKEMVDFITDCQEIFGKENFFLEVQPNDSNEQVSVNQMMRALSKASGAKIVYTTDSHYTSKDVRLVHKAYLNAMDGEREVDEFYSTAYMMDKDEVYSYFEDYVPKEEFEEWTDNTNSVKNMIEIYDLYQPQEVPSIELKNYEPRKPTKEEEKFENLVAMMDSNQQDRYWVNSCIESMKERDLYNDLYLQRLDDEARELLLISERLDITMTRYYNTMQKIIEIIWDEGNSLVGPARGSATGFLSCFLLDITQVDPIETNLPHWRHLSATRPELPDIDIDTEQNKRERILFAMQKFFNQDVPEMFSQFKDSWNVLNVATFGTEAPRSAVKTACRGYTSEEYPNGIDSDVADYLTGMIPSERGITWSIEDCMFGDKDEGRKPIAEFNREIDKYPNLREIILSISGLVNKRSTHASGVYIYNDGFLKHNAMMKAPSGQPTTQFNMSDSDYMGSLKYDFLTVEALDKIRVTIDLLLEDGLIENQGSLKKTYDKYLHPSTLDYDQPKTWELFGSNEVVNLFQFDTPVGASCVKKVQPRSLAEVAAANSLMRLMAEQGAEQPIDRFIRFRDNPLEWKAQMENYRLTKAEEDLIFEYLEEANGVAATQEDVMELVMEEQITNFNLEEANKLRKGIAKKDPRAIIEVKELFYARGQEANTRKELLDYIWIEQIEPQLGYSFSRNHTTPYSLIALQEIYLYSHYPSLYWNTAALTVNSQSMEEDVIEGMEVKNRATDYAKMASAIGTMRSYGVVISLPDINKSDFGFKVDLENDRILFGLKGITRIGDDVVENIIENRPYSSIEDFREKVKVNILQMVNLVKAGTFDDVYPNLTRQEIMKDLLWENCNPKKVLNLRNFNGLIQADLIPEDLDFTKRVYEYTQILRKHFRDDGYFVFNNPQLLDFYSEHFDHKWLTRHNNEVAIKESDYNREVYQPQMDKARDWMKEEQEELLETFNNHLFQEEWDKYAQGSISTWEMDSVSFYYHEHELAHVDANKYGIDQFSELPEQAEVDYWFRPQGKEIPIFKLTRIIGTVISKNKSNGTISLLTTNEVVTVRFRRNYFALFDQQLSETREDGTKRITERSWFSKGNKIMITGYRRGDQFVPKTYARTQSRTLYLIEDISEDGKLVLRSER